MERLTDIEHWQDQEWSQEIREVGESSSDL